MAKNQKPKPEHDVVVTPANEEAVVGTPSTDEKGEGSDIVLDPVPPSTETVEEFDECNIQTREQALKLLAKHGYAKQVREDDTCIFVTQDGNVFLQSNESSAVAHARSCNIKLHRITWD